jgi:hypothetical protein
VPSTKVPKASPPPGGPESTGAPDGEGGSPGKKKPGEPEVVVEKCIDPVDTCLINGKLFACLQISKSGNFSSWLSLNLKLQVTELFVSMYMSMLEIFPGFILCVT